MLLKLLLQIGDIFSTDDGDKIFALFGIAADAEYSLLRPSYKSPVVDVCTTLTKDLIAGNRTLDVLSAIENPQFRFRRDRELDKETEGLEESQLEWIVSFRPGCQIRKCAAQHLRSCYILLLQQ